MKVLFDHNVAEFTVMITGDKNLKHQQNLSGCKLGIIVLPTIDWNILKSETGLVQEALQTALPGSYQVLL